MSISQVVEGKAHILAYGGKISEISKKAAVFYNPRMKLNRDISIFTLSVFAEDIKRPITVADPLAATGVRGIRYALEVSGVSEILFSDLNPTAIRLIKKNIAKNKIKNAVVEQEDANVFLSGRKNKIDFIDIDPFGTPLPFLDSGARVVSISGMLAITATDTAPLSGTYPRASLRKYGAKPLRCDVQHELGIRILIANIARECAKYDKGFIPVLSLSDLHYFRVFGKVRKSKSAADASVKSIGYFIYCKECGYRGFAPDNCQKACPNCSAKTDYAGPLWTGKIFDAEFCSKVFQKSKAVEDKRLEKILGLIRDEALIDAPWYEIGFLSSVFHTNPPRIDEFVEKLQKAGFKASRTHFSPTGVRTDAGINEIRKLI
ncbi:tRNA (guanine(26)-N(2))-dimethyltransferase [uncultured archaeon]|nr:tRNA (guanine(26)-N(2))-dimethyltransferase [uncultured archaeon]